MKKNKYGFRCFLAVLLAAMFIAGVLGVAVFGKNMGRSGTGSESGSDSLDPAGIDGGNGDDGGTITADGGTVTAAGQVNTIQDRAANMTVASTSPVSTTSDNRGYTEDGAKVRAASAKPSLSKTELTLYAGRSYTLKAKGFSGKVTWKSGNKKIAVVNKKGKVTAKKAGTVTITAKCEKQKKSCKVTVKPVKLSRTKATVTEGKSVVLKLYCGATSGMKWATSDKSVVRIKSKSKNQVTLAAKKPGKATVTATYKNKTYKCVVTVKKKAQQAQTTTPQDPDPTPTPDPDPTPTPDPDPIPTPIPDPAPEDGSGSGIEIQTPPIP